jgi:hypothetical protein
MINTLHNIVPTILVINDHEKQWILVSTYTYVISKQRNAFSLFCLGKTGASATGTDISSVQCSWHKTKSHICPNRHLFMKWLILGRMATRKNIVPTNTMRTCTGLYEWQLFHIYLIEK